MVSSIFILVIISFLSHISDKFFRYFGSQIQALSAHTLGTHGD